MEAAGANPAEVNMGLTEILLIVLGIFAFVGSFLIPEKLAEKTSSDIKIPEEMIKDLIAQEVNQAAFQIEEKTDETISAAAEKTERYMERLSNEKIMAIQEYSDTVLSQINKNHEEAVFLYDMLNNKHTQVKNTAAEIDTKVHDVKSNIEQSVQEPSVEVPVATVQITEEEAQVLVGGVEFVEGTSEVKEEKKASKRPAAKKKASNKKTQAHKESEDTKTPEIEIQFDPDSDMGSNKSKILELHKEGKSNMAIARELGLGIGEVKLVIDLFKGGM